MTSTQVLDIVQQFWLQFLLTSISGFLAWKSKMWYNKGVNQRKAKQKEEEDREARLKVLETTLLAMLHDTLLKSLVYFLKVKEITSDEMDNMKLLYESYKALHGNGTIKLLYNRFEKHVKIIPPDYLSD